MKSKSGHRLVEIISGLLAAHGMRAVEISEWTLTGLYEGPTWSYLHYAVCVQVHVCAFMHACI